MRGWVEPYRGQLPVTPLPRSDTQHQPLCHQPTPRQPYNPRPLQPTNHTTKFTTLEFYHLNRQQTSAQVSGGSLVFAVFANRVNQGSAVSRLPTNPQLSQT